MEQLEFFDIPSPCVRICTVDDKGYCLGCMRNRKERFDWLSMTPQEKLYVIRLCRQRYQRKKRRNITPPTKGLDGSEVNQQKDLFS
jgi:predicted Fe-S protein YdhL (DUF1289 family)